MKFVYSGSSANQPAQPYVQGGQPYAQPYAQPYGHQPATSPQPSGHQLPPQFQPHMAAGGPPAPQQSAPQAVEHAPEQAVTIHRAGPATPWGFRLQGGTDYRTQLSVKKVRENWRSLFGH